MIVIGIDPSLTATGICVLRDGNVELAKTTKNRPELGIIERVRLIRALIIDTIFEDLIPECPDLIVIEGFSFSSKGRSVFDIAYLGWRIREDLESFRAEENIPWIEVPPTQLKRFATGVGTANKEIVMQQVLKRWGYEAPNNNLADSFVLAKIGEAYLGNIDGLTQIQQGVISSLKGEKPAKKPRKRGERGKTI